MLGLVLLYFIGKYFYDLAKKNDQNGWLYGILGIVIYYAGTFVGGVILVICYELFEFGSIDEINDTALGITAIPFGLLAAWGAFKLMQNRWEKGPFVPDNDILDDDFMKGFEDKGFKN